MVRGPVASRGPRCGRRGPRPGFERAAATLPPGPIGPGEPGQETDDEGVLSDPERPPVAVQPGETWNFQCWYRDLGNSNNFTDAVSVTFQ